MKHLISLSTDVIVHRGPRLTLATIWTGHQHTDQVQAESAIAYSPLPLEILWLAGVAYGLLYINLSTSLRAHCVVDTSCVVVRYRFSRRNVHVEKLLYATDLTMIVPENTCSAYIYSSECTAVGSPSNRAKGWPSRRGHQVLSDGSLQ